MNPYCPDSSVLCQKRRQNFPGFSLCPDSFRLFNCMFRLMKLDLEERSLNLRDGRAAHAQLLNAHSHQGSRSERVAAHFSTDGDGLSCSAER